MWPVLSCFTWRVQSVSSCVTCSLQGNEVLHQPHLVPVHSPCGTAINTSILYHLLHAPWDAVPWVRSCPLLLSVCFTSKNCKTCFQNLEEETRQSIWLWSKPNIFFFLVNSVEMAVRMWGGNWCSQSESSVSIRLVLQYCRAGFNKHKRSCPCLYICFSNTLFLSTPWGVRSVHIWVERMFPADSPNSISWEKELRQPLATTWLSPSSPFSLERFEIPSILKLANFSPCTPSFEIPS